MEVFLETDRLILRRFTDADLDLLFDLDSDPEVTRFITGGVSEFTEAMLRHWLTQYERWPGYGTWGVIEKESQDFVGWFHLRPETTGRTNRSWDIGSSVPRGARATRPRVLGRSSTRRSPSLARAESSPTRSRSTPHRGA